jgi:hypothetical protein
MGGLRKLRWSERGKGKRGGSSVIYYFHNIEVPLFLMAICAKSDQADIDEAERKLLMARLSRLKSQFKARISK